MLKEAHQFKASKPTLPQALADDGLNLVLLGLGHDEIRSLKPWQSQGKASRARDLQESVDKSASKLLLQWRQRVARAAEVTLAQNQWEAGPALKTSFKLNRSSARQHNPRAQLPRPTKIKRYLRQEPLNDIIIKTEGLETP